MTERPGALALVASRCGDANLNSLGLQIFPDLGRVPDELLISVPEGWAAGAVAELVSCVGADSASAPSCSRAPSPRQQQRAARWSGHSSRLDSETVRTTPEGPRI